MEIRENNGEYLVYENNNLLYTAKNYNEAEWFIKWKNRLDAGNSDNCINC